MHLAKSDLESLGNYAILAAKKAGEIIMDFDRSKLTVNSKIGASSLASQVVTEVDLLSQSAILNVLNATLQEYDLALVTEENVDDKSRFEKDYFWCIDPLDGTLSFIEDKPGYSVSIALVAKNGEPQIGVIFNPIDGTLYSAIKGLGTFKNGQLWQLKQDLPRDNKLTFVYDQSFTNDTHYKQLVDELNTYALQNGYSAIEPVQFGGAAMNAIWVLENQPACYFKFPKKRGGSIWDYAASACIFKELGLAVCDIYGNPMDLNHQESTYMNHRGILYGSNNELSVFLQQLFNKISNI